MHGRGERKVRESAVAVQKTMHRAHQIRVMDAAHNLALIINPVRPSVFVNGRAKVTVGALVEQKSAIRANRDAGRSVAEISDNVPPVVYSLGFSPKGVRRIDVAIRPPLVTQESVVRAGWLSFVTADNYTMIVDPPGAGKSCARRINICVQSAKRLLRESAGSRDKVDCECNRLDAEFMLERISNTPRVFHVYLLIVD